jgi:hypothetical protein
VCVQWNTVTEDVRLKEEGRENRKKKTIDCLCFPLLLASIPILLSLSLPLCGNKMCRLAAFRM